MTVAWPGFMPQLPMRAGNVVSIGENFVRGPADFGTGSRRRRYSTRFDSVSFPLQPVSLEAFNNFMDFYKDDLADGAKSFEYHDPRTLKTNTFHIDAMSYELVSDKYLITLELMRQTT